MATSFVVACSNCSAKLKLKDKSMIGKKVRCPKCSEPFVIKASAKSKPESVALDDGGFYDDPEDEWDDEFGGTSDEFEDEYESVPRKRRTSKKSKKGSKKKGKRREKEESDIPKGVVATLVGGGIIFLLLIGTGIFFLLPLLQGDGPVNRMQWLPNNTQTYVEIRVAEVWKSAVLRPIRTSKMAQEMKKQLKEKGSLEIEDIEKVVVGIPANGGQPIMIISSKVTIDPQKFDPDMTTSTYAGHKIYEDADGQNTGFLLNSKTIVTGSKEMIHSAIDRKGECAVAADFEFLPTRGGIIFGSLSPSNALQQTPLGTLAQETVDLEKLNVVTGVLKFSNDLDIDLKMGFADTTSAKELLTKAEEGLSKTKERLDKQQKELEGGNFVQTHQERTVVMKSQNVISTVKLSGSENDFSVKLSISGSIFEDLVELAEALSGEGGGGFMPGMRRLPF